MQHVQSYADKRIGNAKRSGLPKHSDLVTAAGRTCNLRANQVAVVEAHQRSHRDA